MVKLSLKIASMPGIIPIVWLSFAALFRGVNPIASIYVVSKFVAAVAYVESTNNSSINEVYYWMLAIFGLLIISFITDSVTAIVSIKYEHDVQKSVEKMLIETLYSIPQEHFDDENFNRVLSKSLQAKDSISDILFNFLASASMLVGFVSAFAGICYFNPLIGFVLVSTMLPSLFIEVGANKQRDYIETINNKDWQIMSRTMWILLDPKRMPEIRVLGAFNKLIAKWSSHKSAIFKNEITYEKKVQKKMFGAEMVRITGDIFAYVVTINMIVIGSVNFAEFLMLRGLLSEATENIKLFVRTMQNIHKNTIELKNLNATLLFDKSYEERDHNLENGSDMSIEFESVYFKYPGRTDFALDNVTFSLAAGQKLAFVGENGSGKSTIVKLLLGEYRATSGSIKVNGVDINQISLRSLYDNISILVQNSTLFEALSIEENFQFCSPQKITALEIESAAAKTGAHEFIEKLEHKYGQRLLSIFDDGTQLSGGQVQRICLARSLARGGGLLILDEPTSSIDAEGEDKIFTGIFDFYAGKSMIIVSHKFSAIRFADVIVVMNNGKVVDAGNHNMLIKRDGVYKRLFDIQARGYK